MHDTHFGDTQQWRKKIGLWPSSKLTIKRIKRVFELETGCDAINAFMCRKRQIYSPAVKLSRIDSGLDRKGTACVFI